MDTIRRLTSLARSLGRAIYEPRQDLLRNRIIIEQEEKSSLSSRACKSLSSLGRLVKEEPCPYRPIFTQDRDRIIYSRHYRLLSGKTQVFSPESIRLPESQFIHDRNFHSVKVAQIARTICRTLRLNEDLAEAIAKGHDRGHSPFGHKGEKVLDELSQKHLGKPFKHNRQSLRIADEIEKENLSWEVRNGILCHDGEKKDPILRPYRPANLELDDANFPATLEGCVVRLADRIAYLPLDLADGIMLKLVTWEDVPPNVLLILEAPPVK